MYCAYVVMVRIQLFLCLNTELKLWKW
jgi:hypothetical protein